jgi:3D (Asp-Asp-Asp) domain-containing protein
LIRADERATLGQVLSSRSRVWLAFSCALFGVVSLAAEGCAGRLRPNTPAAPTPGRALPVTVTAYCTGKVTATGKRPTEKTVAADPDLLPIGSRIRVSGLDKRYNRTYVVMDTGSRIRGRRIDLYMRDCREAVAFGRRSGSVTVLH